MCVCVCVCMCACVHLIIHMIIIMSLSYIIYIHDTRIQRQDSKFDVNRLFQI